MGSGFRRRIALVVEIISNRSVVSGIMSSFLSAGYVESELWGKVCCRPIVHQSMAERHLELSSGCAIDAIRG
jgi:hypothetical protein